MTYNEKILLAMAGDEEIYLYPKMANRHGMIAGATGTGKTVTLKVLAESFSEAGVPVFLADIKGDLAATGLAGEMSDIIQSRIEQFGLEEKSFSFQKYPVTYWDVYQKKGLPLRVTISEMGPLLLANVLGLTEIQSDVLSVVFKIADDNGLLLLDTKDLKAILSWVGEHASEYELEYGKMSRQSLSAIVRAVVALEAEGAETFFGEPAVDIADWMKTDISGKGEISILDCQKLITSPKMYAAFMMWLLTEIYERLPEVGDVDRPKMVFFFDEAHLLFSNASKVLLEKIEQVVKLIRSKGVGIFFVTQNPKDIPDGVLAQLGCKIQHALHAYTPAEQKGVKAAANAFRVNPEFDTYEAIQSLGVGEALVSVLDADGIPTVVKKCFILPPRSKMGALSDADRDSAIKNSLYYMKYHDAVDRESAYELLTAKVEASAAEARQAARQAQEEKQKAAEEAKAEKERAMQEAKSEKERNKKAQAEKNAAKRAAKSTATTVAGTVGREIGKSMGSAAGGKFGKTLGGNLGASIARGIIGTLFK